MVIPEKFQKINRMEIVKHGDYISPELSEAFKKYVTRDDLSEVHKKTGVSASNLNQIRHMHNVVTERSSEAVNILAKKAYQRALSEKKAAAKCEKFLKPLVESYESGNLK